MEYQLTKKQEEIYRCIVNFINENGYSPSIRDICERTGRKAVATVYDHVANLRAMGYITYVDNKQRTIRVIKTV